MEKSVSPIYQKLFSSDLAVTLARADVFIVIGQILSIGQFSAH